MTASFRTSRTLGSIDPGKPHIVLVGLPGAGKSTVGLLLAEKLGKTFLDFDLEIERREGMPITQIFGERGEAGFRDMERQLTEELKDLGNMVLAPGGGWIANPQVVALIRPPAKLVYLRAKPETALRRLAGEASARPLLNRPDPMGEMNALFLSRREGYQSADLEVGTELYTPQQIVDNIITALKLG